MNNEKYKISPRKKKQYNLVYNIRNLYIMKKN